MPWLSWARILGIIGIVAIHVFGHLVTAWGSVPALSWHVGNLVDAASRVSVPLFVMASGAVLLRPRSGGGTAESLRSFFRRRASRIAVPLVVWTAFFLWFDRWSQGEPVTAYTFVQGYLWGRPYYHLYFLYVVAGLYLCTPFLRVFVTYASRRLVSAAALTSLALAMASKLQHLWMGGSGGFNAFTYFVPWIGYYLLGYVVATMDVERLRRWFGSGRALGAYVLAVGCTVVATWAFYTNGQPATSLTYDYFVPTTMVAATALAVFLRLRVGDAPRVPTTADTSGHDRPPLARRLADLTLGIFVLHPVPLQLVRQFGPGLDALAGPAVQIGYHVLQLAGLLVGCGLLTYALHRVPVLRRLV